MACNGRCPFCIAGMTPQLGVSTKEPDVNWWNFKKACNLASQSGVTTAMITSKGEPTLFPDQITKFLEHLQEFNFPLIEMQTNGIKLAEEVERYKKHLERWYKLGMITIAISIVHYLSEPNRKVYLPYKRDYIDLPALIDNLHGYGFSVRLTCIAANMFIDSAKKLENLISFAQLHKVEQLTITPVNKTEHVEPGPEHEKTRQWAEDHQLLPQQLEGIKNYLSTYGSEIMRLVHGAIVYDVRGQNVCLNNCLTVQPESPELRNIIFYPDGHARTHWQYPGSIIF